MNLRSGHWLATESFVIGTVVCFILATSLVGQFALASQPASSNSSSYTTNTWCNYITVSQTEVITLCHTPSTSAGSGVSSDNAPSIYNDPDVNYAILACVGLAAIVVYLVSRRLEPEQSQTVGSQ